MENKELLEKARQANSPEELLALAKENDMELTEESAKAYFEQLHKTSELSDEELDNVSGGGCHSGDGRLIVTLGNSCEYWRCKSCGRTHNTYNWASPDCTLKRIDHFKCSGCVNMSYEKGLWLCNFPANNK